MQALSDECKALQPFLSKAHQLHTMTEEERETLCHSIQKGMRACLSKHNDLSHPLRVTILNPLSRVDPSECGAIVMRGLDQTSGKLVVLKDYSLDGDNWLLPLSVIAQIDLYARICDQKSLQQCVDLQLSATNARFVFRYYELDFQQMLFQTNDGDFLLLKVKELLRVVRQLHSQFRIAHRDIKAQNICFTNNTELVLIDFDSAVVCVPDANCAMTEPICTLTTRAPEQVRAELALEAKQGNTVYDALAGDWWAVGCVIAQYYIDRELFQFSEPIVLAQHLENMCDFSAQLRNNLYQSTHPLVVLLRRNIIHRPVLMLLKGLFSLHAPERIAAVEHFLQ